MQTLRDEKPVGVWLEVRYLPPAREGVDQGAVPPATPHPNAASEVNSAPRAYIEIVLLELHDSEYDSHVPRAGGPGRLLKDAPLDVAMSAVARGLSIWEPSKEALEELFDVRDDDEVPDARAVYKTSLLSGWLGGLAMRSVLRISGIAIDGERLFASTGGGWKDFFVRANLVVRDNSAKGWTGDDEEA